MERLFANSNNMQSYNLIVLSYHRFTEQDDDYPFSRTYKQFAHDLGTKDFDWITIDDGQECMIKACAMMQEKNIRAKLFIPTSLVGLPGYCTWDEIWKLSKYHDICNHSHEHVRLTEIPLLDVDSNIKTSSTLIKSFTGAAPRWFVPPWNMFNPDIERIAGKYGMQLVKNRINIKNNSR